MGCGVEIRDERRYEGLPFMERSRYERLRRKSSRIPLFDSLKVEESRLLELFRQLAKENPYALFWEGCSSRGELEYALLVPQPFRVLKAFPSGVETCSASGEERGFFEGTSLEHFVEERFAASNMPDYEEIPELPLFRGGYAGYFGHGMVEKWEHLFSREPGRSLQRGEYPLGVLLEVESFLFFDASEKRLYCVHSSEEEYDRGFERVQTLKERVLFALRSIEASEEERRFSFSLAPPRGNMTKEAFMKMVEAGREAIREGEFSQVVLSQKFCFSGATDPLEVYAALRRANPSPYHVYLGCRDFSLVASSPEIHLSRRGTRVYTRPLAGTRPRGAGEKEDLLLEKELREDPKECAEHLMLVDLARNDLGRFCLPGSVEVSLFQDVERYARVMHLVSQVEGEAAPGASSLEMLGKTFPAGTLSGAPKIRALEYIDTLEPEPRGPYGGVLGWLDCSGNMESCITIRTVLHEKDRLFLQAGAGIVFDSSPEKEYRETLQKAEALARALGCSFENMEEVQA
ncbi:MAG TPA: chorismate-binding protein [Synergistaceae bacterium]|mgnify:FL=1|nr:chorismate-binding protein [Synergistaceae bacterium]